MQPYNVENKGISQQFFLRFFAEWDRSCPDLALDPVLASIDSSRELLMSGQHNVKLSTYYKTVVLAAHYCWDSGFFLRLGASYDIFDLGILGYALISSANLQRSWEVSSALLPHPIKVERSILNDRIELKLFPPKLDKIQTGALCEEWLISTWKWTCQRLPMIHDSKEVEICLQYSKPPHSHVYESVFPGKVLFDQPEYSISFPAHFNEQPFSTANVSVTRLCYEYSVATLPLMKQASDLIDDVRLYLLQSAQIPLPTLQDTADHFNMPIHTLQRRLTKNGTTFRKVIYEARMALTKQYLLGTELSINEIAYLTGYEHPPSFYRAFLKYYNMTPEKYRSLQSIA
ncbi:MAG: helix-turn-helix domain-containing protein [Arenicella sp.]